MIIGIVGLIGSGKDTFAQYLVDNHKFKQESFASSLKDSISAIFGWNRFLLDGLTQQSREWREQPDEWWSNRLGKEITPRWVLQNIGTDLMRNQFHEDCWVASLENKLRMQSDNIVISDCRFPNEIAAIRNAGGTIIKIERGFKPDWHIDAQNAFSGMPYSERVKKRLKTRVHFSEWAWYGSNIDYSISNNGTIDELYTQVDSLITNLASNPPAST